MKNKPFNSLGDCPPLANDCFVRYFFTYKGVEKGKLEGIKEGEKNKTILLAKSMKKENIDIETIKRITGLTVDEIEKL